MSKKKSKDSGELAELFLKLRCTLSSIHSANLSNIENKEIFIDKKLDTCTSLLSQIENFKELNNIGII